MKWFFQPGAGDAAARDDDDDSASGLLGLPAALLERHGVRVLHPAHAALVDGYPRPRSTVYRSSTLLVPDDLLRDGDFVMAVNEVLKLVGMRLVPPTSSADAGLDTRRVDQRIRLDLGRLPRPAVLVPLARNRLPVDIDAWTALQTLRAATIPERRVRGEAESAAPKRKPLKKAQVDRIGLEHVAAGSAINGSPADSGGGGLAGGSGSGGQPGITDSYVFNGGDTRTPVAVFLDPPARRQAGDCVTRYGRRPVVAVLDSGVREHPWLNVAANGSGGYTMTTDSFVTIDPKIQAEIFKEGKRAAAKGDKHRQVIKDAWDKSVAGNPLVGEVDTGSGHCTFIAGIVRQVVPDATVLAVRVMHADDILYEGDIICALRHLAKRIATAEPGDLAAQVDVLSLSFGYFSEARLRKRTSGLWRAIEVLISLGVIVFAAAGNYASGRKFYPAAFALKSVPPGQVPVTSVGALDPNGAKAMFSNEGDWVTAWATGAHVVSTYPVDIDGSRTPDLRIPVNRKPAGHWPPGREALDPDDFSCGFALWSGTSFSAPYAAALVTRSLLKGAKANAGLRLDTLGTAKKQKRALAAYDNLPRSIE